MTKKVLNLDSDDHYTIDGDTLSEGIAHLQKLASQFGADAKINFLVRWDGDVYFEVKYSREETDDEYIARLDREHMVEVSSREARRKQYEQLKKEFASEAAE